MNLRLRRARRRPDQHLPGHAAVFRSTPSLVAVGLGVLRRRRLRAAPLPPIRPDEVKFDQLLQDVDAGDDDDVPVIVEFNDETNADELDRRTAAAAGASASAACAAARPACPSACCGKLARRGAVRRVHYDRPVEALRRPHRGHDRRQDRAAAHGLHRRRHRRGGDRLGHHALPRRPALRRQQDAARHQVRRLRRTARPRPTTTGATARTSPASSPATATTATAPAPASRPRPRSSRSRRSTARARAASARSSRRSTGPWPTAPPTTSASSTCRSARACSRATTPTR